MINKDDDDERLADNECYANGNPPGRLPPLNTATRSQYHEERSVFKEIQKIQSQI